MVNISNSSHLLMPVIGGPGATTRCCYNNWMPDHSCRQKSVYSNCFSIVMGLQKECSQFMQQLDHFFSYLLSNVSAWRNVYSSRILQLYHWLEWVTL